MMEPTGAKYEPLKRKSEMKKILLTGAVMLMMTACSNEEILTNEEVVNNAEPTLTIIATQGDAES